MYKSHAFVLLSLLLSICSVKAQTKKEAGFFAGTSYYLGDINPTRQFYDPLPSFGGLFKYYLNSRHCIRISGYYGQFQGRDRDFSNEFQQVRNRSFHGSLLDVGAMYEFDFLPLKYDPRIKAASPFLFGGIAYDFPISTQYPIGPHLSLPFGFGVKCMMSRKITIGLEWSFRKTFQDNIDGVNSPGGNSENSSLSNKDWYSFAGFFITFRLFDNTGNCPVYPQK